jgi:hypothetical protein
MNQRVEGADTALRSTLRELVSLSADLKTISSSSPPFVKEVVELT